MKVFSRTILAIFLAIVSVAGFVFYANYANATANFNQQINYQGKLTGSTGAAVTDGNYYFKFYLCTSASDCSSAGSVWNETYCASGCNGSPLAVSSGLFSVMLGQYSSLSLSLIHI